MLMNAPGVTKSKNAELARAGDTKNMRCIGRIGRPYAELVISDLKIRVLRRRSLAASCGRNAQQQCAAEKKRWKNAA
jgi:hypothetical protein